MILLRHRARRTAALLASSVVLTSIALGQVAQVARADGVALTNGDVLAATGSGMVKHFDPAGNLLDTLNTTTNSVYTTGMCFNSSHDLFVTTFDSSSVSEFAPDGTLLNANWATVSGTAESCTVDASNNMYVGGPFNSFVYKIDPSGAVVNTFTVTSAGLGTDWVDLSSDQCTLLYAGEGPKILSYNVCTQTQNPDFTDTLPGSCFELRFRPNGEVIVACGSEVVRMDSAGTVLQTYPLAGVSQLFSMNLDPDNTSFWTGDINTGQIYHVDIASGNILGQFASSPSTSLAGLTIVGGIVVSQPSLELAPPTATVNVGTSHSVTATITNPGGTLAGQSVTFTATGANTTGGTATTDANGQAVFSYVGTNAGTDSVTATFTNTHSASASGSASVTWIGSSVGTTLTVAPGSSDFADPTTLSAVLTNSGTQAPIAGKPVTLTLNGVEQCTGTTSVTGTVACQVTPGEAAGGYTVSGLFAGDSTDAPASGSASFLVTHEETSVAYTGPSSAVNGQPLTLTGVLTTDDPTAGTGLGGKSVTLSLGTGAGTQSCSATSSTSGGVTCTVASVNQPVGPSVTVSASFAGDSFYSPSQANSSISVFAPNALGAFVIGNGSAGAPTLGRSVNFWGSQWSKGNSLSGGVAPSSMKGFANSPTSVTCGGTWTTTTGASSSPPPSLPGQIDVIVSSKVTQSGSTISGDIQHIVVVQVGPGYGPGAGQLGKGTIVSVIC